MAVGSESSTRSNSASTVLAREARVLAYTTIAWMLLEAGVSMWAAIRAGSVALLAFGLDSVIEVVSGTVVLWRFSGRNGAAREARAARVVGITLIAVAVFIGWDSIAALTLRRMPDTTILGIVIAAASLVLMPLLAQAKRRVAVRTGSRALAGDARQSDICGWLALLTLVGLVLRAAMGWWWVDSVTACVLLPFILYEGVVTFLAPSLDRGCCD